MKASATRDYQQQNEHRAALVSEDFLSHSFKVWTTAFIFFLTFFHLFTLLAFRKTIFPTELILGIVLFLVGYLWMQEVRARERIQTIHDDLQEMYRKLQDVELDTILTLVMMEEARDPYAHGHSQHVARLAVAIADTMEFSADPKETLRRAAVLHNLGTIAVPQNILKKPERLTPEERGIIERHPRTAMDILKPLRFLHLERKIILHHHERWDGNGYPDGLRESKIPLESRIIALADTFITMNSDRPYRRALAREDVLHELEQSAGTQLDASLVQRLLQLLQKHPEYWELGFRR